MLQRCCGPRVPRFPCFNPHPALRPDAARCLQITTLATTSFNPHPALRPDAAECQPCPTAEALLFQSSSGPSTGCCWASSPPPNPRKPAFQSSSGPSTGCCVLVGDEVAHIDVVSILIRPFDRMLPAQGARHPAAYRPVSILIRPFDRMLRGGGPGHPDHQPPRFNPHPALRPDAAGVSAGGLVCSV